MSRTLEARLRTLEVRARMGDALEDLSDEGLFAHSRGVAAALVQKLGGLEPALDFLREDGGDKLADFGVSALACQTSDDFMGYSPGWDAWKQGAACC